MESNTKKTTKGRIGIVVPITEAAMLCEALWKEGIHPVPGNADIALGLIVLDIYVTSDNVQEFQDKIERVLKTDAINYYHSN